MLRPAALALLIACASGCAAAPPPTVSVTDLRDRIAMLASDDFAGRMPGTEGGAKAEAYIRAAFREAGLAPGAKDGWRQPVALVTDRPGAAMLRAGDLVVAPTDLALIGIPETMLRAAPLIYAGSGETIGATAPRGAVVLLDSAIKSGRGLGERTAALGRAGAAAVIVLPDAARDWAGVRRSVARGQTRFAGEAAAVAVNGWMNRTAAAAVIAAAGGDLATLVERAGKPGFTPVALPAGRIDLTAGGTRTKLAPANIIGKVAGSDPAAGAVLLTAHWDHLGLCRPEGAPDRICNGADDNASGVAMLIEIARRVAAGPRPVRDVYFVATTAEEMGLLGATALAAAPPAPLTRIVAALNLDTAAIAPAGKAVAILGRGRTPALDRVIDATALKLGRRNDSDQEAEIMLQRQDGWALARYGVPAVMVSGSFSDMDLLKAYLAKQYHGPEDDLAHLPDLAGAAEDATLHVALVRALADPKLYAGPGPAVTRN